jgi:hypothetical protein
MVTKEQRVHKPSVATITKESRFHQALGLHLRRKSILLVNTFLNHRSVFKTIGWFNRRWRFLETLFVAYPASDDYTRAYVSPKQRDCMRWHPWLVGLIWQNGTWGLVFIITSTETDFLDPQNKDNLKTLVDDMSNIQQLVGASQKTFAGILPGVLFSKRLIRTTVETDVTVQAVIKAEQCVREAEGYPDDVPLILLGGFGFVGRRLMAKLKEREIYCIDVANDENTRSIWPNHISGKKAIVINVTRKAALSEYIDLFWKELIVLNEVYPEPGKQEIERLTLIGSPVYHLVGVTGKAFPPFPKAYAGAVPCCAGHMSDDLAVIIKKLNEDTP